MKKSLAASGAFLLFLLAGGVWISLTHLLPEGVPRTVVIIALGFSFIGIFLWLLVTHVRNVLGGPERLGRELGLTFLDLALLLLAFAWMYQMIGIVDNRSPESQVVHDFVTCVYYSIVTFTTLGYGDFIPRGPGRVLAAMEALTGYLILGILASTGASVLRPGKAPRIVDEAEEE